MVRRVTPMIHVPDVRKAVDWYESIGFVALRTGDDRAEVVWAELAFGDGKVMFSAGSAPSAQERREVDLREVDLYVQTRDVDVLFRQLQDRVHVREEPHNTFYGMREFIIRDSTASGSRSESPPSTIARESS